MFGLFYKKLESENQVWLSMKIFKIKKKDWLWITSRTTLIIWDIDKFSLTAIFYDPKIIPRALE